MSREVRRVPKDWKHSEGQSLFDGYDKALSEWIEADGHWKNGLCRDWSDYPEVKWKAIVPDPDIQSYEEWDGPRPRKGDYMPDWPEAERTHYQMYETTSEGSPISPVLESPEMLARWLVDNEASAMGRHTGSYEGWLRVANGGYAPTMVSGPGNALVSGVDGQE